MVAQRPGEEVELLPPPRGEPRNDLIRSRMTGEGCLTSRPNAGVGEVCSQGCRIAGLLVWNPIVYSRSTRSMRAWTSENSCSMPFAK